MNYYWEITLKISLEEIKGWKTGQKRTDIRLTGTWYACYFLTKQENFIIRYFFSYRNSFRSKLIRTVTGLDYHIIKQKANGNGLMDAHLTCEFPHTLTLCKTTYFSFHIIYSFSMALTGKDNLYKAVFEQVLDREADCY